MLGQSQLSIPARYLYCVLLQHCGKDDHCWPGQKRLADIMKLQVRQIRNLINELIVNEVVIKRRLGYNQTNTYTLAKELKVDRQGIAHHISSKFPLNTGNKVPNKNTYIKTKDKRSLIGLENMRKNLLERGIIK